MAKHGEKDYRDLTKDGVKPQDDRLPDNATRRWWDKKTDEAAQSIISTVEFLAKAQAGRMRQHLISARLYGNLAMLGSAATGQQKLQATQQASRDRITFNAIQSIIDTLTSRVGETKPRPYYLTSGGSYSQQRKAKKLNQFTEGVFYETQTYDKGLDCFRDAAIWGDGLMHVYGRGGKLHHERMLSSEFWIDEVEAMYGFPRSGYRVKDVDRDELAAMWSDDKKAVKLIEAASRVSDTDGGRGESISDMIRVVEAWRLADMDDNGDLVGGHHAFAVCGTQGNALLGEIEPWEFDFFPFARLPWCKRPIGYWSQGLCEQLQAQQLGVNRKLWFIDRAMQLAGTVKVAIRNGSRISKEHISNDIGAILEYTGEAPQFFTAQPVHQQLFDSVNIDIERMYRVSGASEMSTSAKKPAGLNSGKALREFEDIESERHRTTSRLNDNFYLQIAALDAAFAPELKGYKVKVPGRNAFSLIDFKKDVGDISEDDFVRQCFPVSRLPRDPAGRLQTIQEYIQAGFMTPRQGRRALDFPDLEAVESLATAQEDMLSKVLDGILDDGKYRPPEPTDDLALGKEMVLEYLQRYRQFDDAEPEKLDMLRRWNSQVDMLMKRAMGPALQALPGGMPSGAPSGPATPQAVPNRPPSSDLLPQAA